MIVKKKKNTADGANLSSEFDDIEFDVNDPFDDSKGSVGDQPGVENIPPDQVTASRPFKIADKTVNRGKKSIPFSVADCVDYAKDLEATGFFKRNKTTSINITLNTAQLTSTLVKYFDNVAYYQFVSAIIMKVLTNNKEEVKNILDEIAKKNSENLI